MKIRVTLSLTALLILAYGCSHQLFAERIPLTSVERLLVESGEMEDPILKCSHGYVKIYYVLRKDTGDDHIAFYQWDCITDAHAAALEELKADETDDARRRLLIDSFSVGPPMID